MGTIFRVTLALCHTVPNSSATLLACAIARLSQSINLPANLSMMLVPAFLMSLVASKTLAPTMLPIIKKPLDLPKIWRKVSWSATNPRAPFLGSMDLRTRSATSAFLAIQASSLASRQRMCFHTPTPTLLTPVSTVKFPVATTNSRCAIRPLLPRNSPQPLSAVSRKTKTRPQDVITLSIP